MTDFNIVRICTWLRRQPRSVEKRTETFSRSKQTRRQADKMSKEAAEFVAILIYSTFWKWGFSLRFGDFYRPCSRFSGMSINPVIISVSPVLPWPPMDMVELLMLFRTQKRIQFINQSASKAWSYTSKVILILLDHFCKFSGTSR